MSIFSVPRFFHKRYQEERIKLNCDRVRRNRASFYLPVLEDANSIQVSLMQIMRLLASRQIDSKTASLLLYALQTASVNLRQTTFESTHIEDVVIDRRTIDQTCIGCDQWSEEDFPDEEEMEEEKAEAAVEQAAETAASAPSAIAARVGTAALGCPVERSSTSSATKPASIPHIPATQPLPPPPANKQPAAGQNKSAQSHRPSATAKLSKKKAPKKVDMNQVRENIRGKVRDWIMKTAKEASHSASRGGRPEASHGRLEADN